MAGSLVKEMKDVEGLVGYATWIWVCLLGASVC